MTGIASAQTTNSLGAPTGSATQMNVSPEQIFGIGGPMAEFIVVVFSFLVAAYFQLIILVSVVMVYDLARSFGKGMAFTLGLIALPVVFWPILGFGDAEYRGPVAHPNMVDNGGDAHIADAETQRNENTESNQPNTEESDDGEDDPFVG
jgi:hypothetical protein